MVILQHSSWTQSWNLLNSNVASQINFHVFQLNNTINTWSMLSPKARIRSSSVLHLTTFPVSHQFSPPQYLNIPHHPAFRYHISDIFRYIPTSSDQKPDRPSRPGVSSSPNHFWSQTADPRELDATLPPRKADPGPVGALALAASQVPKSKIKLEDEILYSYIYVYISADPSQQGERVRGAVPLEGSFEHWVPRLSTGF